MVLVYPSLGLDWMNMYQVSFNLVNRKKYMLCYTHTHTDTHKHSAHTAGPQVSQNITLLHVILTEISICREC